MINFQLINARINPGIPAIKKADRQPNDLAIATNKTGAIKNPNKVEPKLCKKPILNPSRPGQDSLAINDWIKGKVGPSDKPINSRVTNKMLKDIAKPELIEQIEKASTESTKTNFLRS